MFSLGEAIFPRNPGGFQGKSTKHPRKKIRRLGALACFKQALVEMHTHNQEKDVNPAARARRSIEELAEKMGGFLITVKVNLFRAVL